MLRIPRQLKIPRAGFGVPGGEGVRSQAKAGIISIMPMVVGASVLISVDQRARLIRSQRITAVTRVLVT
jgi:hypothetical protein